MYICICNAVNDEAINGAIDDGASSVDEIFEALDVVVKCGTCQSGIERMIQAVFNDRAGVEVVDPTIASSREYSLAAE